MFKISCQRCKKKKVKCDRLLPSCTQCSKVGNDCIYKERLKPGPKTQKKHNSQQILEVKEARLFDIITPKIQEELIAIFIENTKICNDLGLDKSYLSNLVSNNCYLLISGIATIISCVSPKYSHLFHSLFNNFQHQILLYKNSLPTFELKNEDKILEFMQSLTVNSDLLFMISKPKQSMIQLTSCSQLIEAFDYHLVDLVDFDNPLREMKRCVYWTVYQMCEYKSLGTGLNAQFNRYGHCVNLPGCLINLRSIKYNMSNKEIISQSNLSLRDIHLVYLDKIEKISIWSKKVKYLITKTLISEEILDQTVEQYKIFQKQILQYNNIFSNKDILLKADDPISYFSEYVLVSAIMELLNNQSIIELVSSKINIFSELLKNCNKNIITVVDKVSPLISILDINSYLNDPFIIFSLNIILKILIYHSNLLIQSNQKLVVNLIDSIVEIMKEMSEKYNNELAKQILKDFNSKFEVSLFDSFVYIEGIDSSKLSYFNDFISSDINTM